MRPTCTPLSNLAFVADFFQELHANSRVFFAFDAFGAVAIYHARNRKDPDEVISFGIFDVDDPAAIRGDEQAELKRQDAMAAFVENIPLEGVYEVIEEIKP